MISDYFEKFYEYRREIEAIVGKAVESEITTSLGVCDIGNLEDTLKNMVEAFPFVDAVYSLDGNGIQEGRTFISGRRITASEDTGQDRSHRPYFITAKNRCAELGKTNKSISTPPYMSSLTKRLCITFSVPICDGDSILRVVCVDVDLKKVIRSIEGDTLRSMFDPIFKLFYILLSISLLSISIVILYYGMSFMGSLKSLELGQKGLSMVFEDTILMTLSLAIFDLSKTVMEEEVLSKKDVKKTITTRKTLMKFISAILIATSIEGLMLIFKFSMGDYEDLPKAVSVVIASAIMLIALGIYTWLSTIAEIKWNSAKKKDRRDMENDSDGWLK